MKLNLLRINDIYALKYPRTTICRIKELLWDVALVRSYMNRRFGGTSVHTRSTQRHIATSQKTALFTVTSVKKLQVLNSYFLY
jgi:hypothetical protein